jgi:hypothetical protein
MQHSPQKQSPAGQLGFAKSQTTDRGLQAHRITLPPADQSGEKFAPYARDVADSLARGTNPIVYIFAGLNAWERAAARRKARGADSAIVLPAKENPLALKWPAIESVIVAWPGRTDLERKLDLARALIRDGCKHAEIEHDPEWISARAKVIA